MKQKHRSYISKVNKAMCDTILLMETFLYLYKPLDDAVFQILRIHNEINKLKLRWNSSSI